MKQAQLFKMRLVLRNSLLLTVFYLSACMSYCQDGTATTIQKSGTNAVDSLAVTPADFRGGIQEWVKYVGWNLRLPSEYDGIKVDESIVVQFTVTEKGKVANAHALAGPPPLQKEAVRLVKESGRWNPALQNQKPVTSVCERRIIFKFNM